MRSPIHNGIDDIIRDEAYNAAVKQERAEVYRDEQERKKISFSPHFFA